MGLGAARALAQEVKPQESAVKQLTLEQAVDLEIENYPT